MLPRQRDRLNQRRVLFYDKIILDVHVIVRK
jgi:hypothetical protein